MSSRSFFMPAMVANVGVVRSLAPERPQRDRRRVDPLDVTSSPWSVRHGQRLMAAFQGHQRMGTSPLAYGGQRCCEAQLLSCDPAANLHAAMPVGTPYSLGL
jgi:hypothetical protein